MTKKNNEKNLNTEVKQTDNAKIIDKKDVVENKKPKNKRVKKSACRILVATPSYFVINKNGEEIKIEEKNNYHRGEEIYF